MSRRASHILLSVFLSASGSAGGYALTYKLAGNDASLSFLCLGASVVAALLGMQIVLAKMSSARATYLVLFNISFSFGLVWFMLCLILPMFWVSAVDPSVKYILLLASIGLCYVNVSKGIELFNLRWAQVGTELLSRYYDRTRSAIEWGSVVGALRVSVSIYIPGVSEKLSSFISVALVMSMLAGLSLRKVFPIFSLFAWGIPLVIVVSLVMQMIGLTIGQLLTLTALEKKAKNIIRPL